MIRRYRKILAIVAGFVAIGLLASGCGRRGALEAPVTDNVVVSDEQGNSVKKPPSKPDRSFILDGLI